MLKEKKNVKWIIGIIGVVVVIAVAGLIFVTKESGSRFAKGTQINGMDVSGMTLDGLKEKLKNYKLTLLEKDKKGKTVKEVISGKDFDVHMGDNTTEAKEILKEQGVFDYIAGKGKKHTVSDWLSYDEEKLEEKIDELSCFLPEFYVKPVNASISSYEQGKGFEMIPEQEGNCLDQQKTKEAIKEAVRAMESKLDLKKKDCYEKPQITKEDKILNKTLDKMNKYAGVTITYQFDENEEVLDGSTIAQWLKVTKKNKVKIQKEKVAEYVAGLRRKYDTIFSQRKFKTSYGNTVTVVGGDYGWWMNYKKEEEELIKTIKKGKSTQRTPEYYQTAESYGKKDYGNSYVEINLTTQHVFVYIDGKKVIETDCVTGNSSRGFDTPAGTYSITYTQKDATLKGENYSTPVKYWMPFNGNIGLHDANWRNRFGGSIYKTNGSHGCVNLPPAKAAQIFGKVKAGMPVICYHSEQTASAKKTKKQK